MSETVAGWGYTKVVDARRVDALQSVASFASLLQDIALSCKVAAFVWEPGNADRLRGLRRAAFLLDVPTPLYDAFFNSPVGYRAQFALSIGAGLAANRAMVESLEPTLLEDCGSLERELVLASVRGEGAKVWIHEPEVEAQMGRTEPEIYYEPWASASTDGAGLLAPVGSELEVKGAWVNALGRVFVDPYKAGRGRDIHEVGYT